MRRTARVIAVASAAVALTLAVPAVGSAADLGTAPSGCVGAANSPHKSTHEPGRVNAEARTTCQVAVPHIVAKAQLQRQIVWIWWYVASDNKDLYNNKRVSAFANETCNNAKYRLAGYHEVTDHDGEVYVGLTTSREADIAC
jgi:hypothetical protein